MNKIRAIVGVSFFICILVLSLLGGAWNQTYAQSTVPTEPPTPVPGDLPEPYEDVKCIGGTIDSGKELDLFIPRFPNTKSEARWGGVLNPVGSACQEAYEVYCVIPVRYLPKRSSMFYYRQGVQIYQRVNGKIDATESCAPKQVYFELSRYERFMYDHFNERFGFYIFNDETKKWETCPEVVFDEDVGLHGRLTCRTLEWGYFAIGWPAKK